MAEKMNSMCANKLLKLIEEPTDKTVIILVTEDEEQLINTIRSRCQVVQLNPLSEESINRLGQKSTGAKIQFVIN